MRFHPVLAAAAFLALVATAPAGALPPGNFCELNPDSPLCNPDEPPIDPCPGDPELCEPPDPCVVDPASCEPPDPCELDPASCEPEPDPCELDPASCEPEDPCVLDPASCEPAEEPTVETGTLAGNGRVKGPGFKEKEPLELQLILEGDSFTIVSGPCEAYQGQMAPKGKSGKKLQLFLDAPSADAYGLFVGQRAAEARGAAVGAMLGGSSKLTLKLGDEGSASLKLKSEFLFEAGEVVFKAQLKGVLTEPLALLVPRCP